MNKELKFGKQWQFLYIPCFSVHHMLFCSFGCFDNRSPLLSTSPPVWESLDLTVYGSWQRRKRIQTNGNVTSRFGPSTHMLWTCAHHVFIGPRCTWDPIYGSRCLSVCLSVRDVVADLTDATLAVKDINSILTDNVKRALQGNAAIKVTQPDNQLWNQYKRCHPRRLLETGL